MVTFNADLQYQLRQPDLYKLYMKFGEDYKNPCSRYVIDILNDSASKQVASSYFKKLNDISQQMLKDVKPIMEEKCYFNVKSLQLNSARLPSRYDAALQATNAAFQEAISVKQE